MAARKRQVHTSEQTNGKNAAVKANFKGKHNAKGKTKDEDTSKQRSHGVLYKICLIAAGKQSVAVLFVLLSILDYPLLALFDFF